MGSGEAFSGLAPVKVAGSAVMAVVAIGVRLRNSRRDIGVRFRFGPAKVIIVSSRETDRSSGIEGSSAGHCSERRFWTRHFSQPRAEDGPALPQAAQVSRYT